MPIYEYACSACGHQLEAIQKISDQPLQECPVCGQSTLRKLVSAAGFRLKGGGWYETDFKKKEAQKNIAPQDNSSNATASTEPTSTSTSTPATSETSSTSD